MGIAGIPKTRHPGPLPKWVILQVCTGPGNLYVTLHYRLFWQPMLPYNPLRSTPLNENGVLGQQEETPFEAEAKEFGKKPHDMNIQEIKRTWLTQREERWGDWESGLLLSDCVVEALQRFTTLRPLPSLGLWGWCAPELVLTYWKLWSFFQCY